MRKRQQWRARLQWLLPFSRTVFFFVSFGSLCRFKATTIMAQSQHSGGQLVQSEEFSMGVSRQRQVSSRPGVWQKRPEGFPSRTTGDKRCRRYFQSRFESTGVVLYSRPTVYSICFCYLSLCSIFSSLLLVDVHQVSSLPECVGI